MNQIDAGPESKTPRTDAEAADAANYASIAKGWFVHADFARQLETELAAAHDAYQSSEQAARAVLWAIGELQRELMATLEKPGGGSCGIG